MSKTTTKPTTDDATTLRTATTAALTAATALRRHRRAINAAIASGGTGDAARAAASDSESAIAHARSLIVALPPATTAHVDVTTKSEAVRVQVTPVNAINAISLALGQPIRDAVASALKGGNW